MKIKSGLTLLGEELMLTQSNETLAVVVENNLVEVEEVELTADAYNNCCKIVQLG